MLETLDQAASRAGNRYSTFLLSLRGIYQQVSDAAPGDMRALEAIRNTATPLAQTFLDTERESYREDLFDIQKKASDKANADMTGDVGVEAPWDTTGDEMADWYAIELGAQVWRDINTAVHARRMTSMSRKKMDPNFAFKDRLGRQYASDGYVKQTARHGLVLFAVKTYANTASAHGATSATVTHPVKGHKHNGLPIQLNDLADHLAEVFHPNSRAFLEATPV